MEKGSECQRVLVVVEKKDEGLAQVPRFESAVGLARDGSSGCRLPGVLFLKRARAVERVERIATEML